MIILLLSFSCLSMISAVHDCFEKTSNHALVASAIGKPKKIPLDICQKACLDEKGRCRSILYFNSIGVCIMNKEDKDTQEQHFVASKEHVDYYHRTCYHKRAMAMRNWRRDDAAPDACFEVVKGRVLIGIVDQLLDETESMEKCQKACLNAKKTSDIVCKSAMWYPKEKECILASQNKADIAELYIEDANSFYMENKCVDGGPAKDKMKQPEPAIEASEDENESEDASTTPLPTPPPTLLPSTEKGTTPPTISSTNLGSLMKPTQQKGSPDAAFHAEGEPPSQAPRIEQSGYDTAGESVQNRHQVEEPLPTTTVPTKNVPTIDPKTIDSYQVETKKEELAVQQYSKRLRDARVKNCFTEIFPSTPMFESRVMKAYSLEQCIDICRLCKRCIKGSGCVAAAYDMQRENCAISHKRMVNGGVSGQNSALVYFTKADDC